MYVTTTARRKMCLIAHSGHCFSDNLRNQFINCWRRYLYRRKNICRNHLAEQYFDMTIRDGAAQHMYNRVNKGIEISGIRLSLSHVFLILQLQDRLSDNKTIWLFWD